MKGKKHRPEQIIKKLREADAMLAAGKTIGHVAQALEISEQTFQRSAKSDPKRRTRNRMVSDAEECRRHFPARPDLSRRQ